MLFFTLGYERWLCRNGEFMCILPCKFHFDYIYCLINILFVTWYNYKSLGMIVTKHLECSVVVTTLLRCGVNIVLIFLLAIRFLGNDLCLHYNTLVIFFLSFFFFAPFTCGMHEVIFHQRATGVPSRNSYIVVWRLFCRKIFSQFVHLHTVLLFHFWWPTNHTSLTYCIWSSMGNAG
jgi:hypothetical protein